MIRVVDLAAAHRESRDELEASALRVLRSGRYLGGPELESFEREFAEYCETAGCVGVSSGFDALQLALRALGVGPGDEVVVSAFTAVPTWLAISAVGARPVPVEPADDTLLIDPAAVDAAVGPRTAAIVMVHLYGLVCDADAIAAIAREHRVALVADAAQAHGARYRGRSIGALADAAAFSMYPTKNLGAAGNGGAVVSGDHRLLERVRAFASTNRTLDELTAATLRVKLEKLDRWNDTRRRRAARYTEALADIPGVRLPQPIPDSEPVWHQYVVRVEDRDAVRTQLHDSGIETLVHYPKAPHQMDAYGDLGLGALPVTERIAAEVLSLPVASHVSDADEQQICESLEAAVRPARVP
jgi:dTDP-3-amino-3,4,6-trideoxy-alpha-D-glucose transaminase